MSSVLTGGLRRFLGSRNPIRDSQRAGAAGKKLDAASKIAAVLGIAMLLIEELFRVNLSKHRSLVAFQLGVNVLIVCFVLIRTFRFRSALFDERELERANSTMAVERPSVSHNTFARRSADYFGMSGSTEFVVATAFFVCLLLLNVLNVLRPGFNSDEPQHLHVIWGWTRGLVQYRDIFDNHMPLFHIVFAPIFGLIGERATILYWMRFALLPMYLVAAWSIYQIGAHLFSRRAGVWALLGVGFFSGYYPDATDFRPNNLWTPVWLLCIAILVRGELTPGRAVAAGLLLGFAFAVSMKSTVFLLSLLVSAPVALVLVGRKKLGGSWLSLARVGVAFVVGTALVPAAIMIFFARGGAWGDFRYGVFDFNFLANRVYQTQLVYKSHPALAIMIGMIVIPVVLYVARWIVRSASDNPSLALRRALVLLVCATYFLLLQVFWPPISRTYPPIHPLVFVLSCAALIAISERLEQWRHRFQQLIPIPAFIVVAELSVLLGAQSFLKEPKKSETKLLRNVVALTEPDDYVLDCKGETVFRRRCFSLIMERITIKSIQQGLIIDDAPQRCIQTHTCVVASITMQRFSEATRDFINRNYLPVSDDLRVAGATLQFSAAYPNRCDFDVVIPASYKIISRSGNVAGTLDGTPYDGARFLTAGRHTFESASAAGGLVLLWAQAIDRHFKPVGWPDA